MLEIVIFATCFLDLGPLDVTFLGLEKFFLIGHLDEDQINE